MVVKWVLNGQQFMGLHSGKWHKFSPAISYVFVYETLEEIDHYCNKLGQNGIYNQCGWLDDHFGVSWQVVPKILGSLMVILDNRVQVVNAFVHMKKYDFKKFLNT